MQPLLNRDEAGAVMAMASPAHHRGGQRRVAGGIFGAIFVAGQIAQVAQRIGTTGTRPEGIGQLARQRGNGRHYAGLHFSHGISMDSVRTRTRRLRGIVSRTRRRPNIMRL